MKEFTLRQLQYFVAVADEGSISAAARSLHVSPGAVSLAVSELETSLGVQLTLRRRAMGVTLTRAGLLAAEQARAVLRESDELHNISQVLRGELSGTLRIGCFTTLSPWLLPRIIAHFARRHPGVRVEVLETSSDVLQQRLQDGDLDVCLMYAQHIRTRIDHEEIVPVRVQLVLPADHRLADRDEVAFRELGDEPAVLLALRPVRDLVEEILRKTGFRPNVAWRIANVETIRSMVGRGLGYSVLMGRPFGDRTYDGLPLVYKRIADEVPDNAVVLAHPRGSVPTAKVRALADFCRREFAEEGHPVQ
ncbi:LysR substrate-binding domain-containing protein [Prauserella flavalba]|uniref:HTH lysR-type domain-containing protein n=1 Tax=Prauserella flavalba TaxID=1477506 RepID=A0A318LS32_9PSEU|nr:LysR substrate-binding domain-containing protein [Prauserella flavalba]PXY24433.1 hypothetical protein BA062_29950 [Prauserella flavalba]